MFNGKTLNSNLTVAEAGITNNSNIFIVNGICVKLKVNNKGTMDFYCFPGQKVSEIIEKYRNKNGDRDVPGKFMLNAKNLDTTLTLAEDVIEDGSVIFVD